MNMQTNSLKERSADSHRTSQFQTAGGSSQRGSSLLEMAFLLPFLLLLVIGVADFARAYYVGIEVQNAARAGAQYGLLNSSDTAGMQTAATNDAPDVSGMTATATYGCMCSDGSGVSATCTSPPSCSSSTEQITYVQVNTSATYSTFFPWPKIPSSFVLSGRAILWAGN